MLKKGFKWVGFICLALITINLIRVLPLLFPQPFFDHRYTQGAFTFYAEQPINDDQKRHFNRAITRLKASDLFDPSGRFRIFLCQTPGRYAFFAGLVGKNEFSQGLNLEPTHNIFISEPFIKHIQDRYGEAYPYSLLEGNLVHILTHEVVHSLMTNRLGLWTSRALPPWKREGYAEYAASRTPRSENPGYHFADRVESLFDGSLDHLSPARQMYYRSQILMEYLMDIKGVPFDRIMSERVNEKNTLAELTRWYRAQ